MKISIPQAAKLLGVTAPTIYNKIKSGKLTDLGRSSHGKRQVDADEVIRLEIMPRAMRRFLSETQRRGHAQRRTQKKTP